MANFHDAQLHDTLAIDLQLDWHDEDTEDLKMLSREVEKREDIIGVIGPFTSEHVELFAPACQANQTPMIAPAATSEDIIRRYAVASSGSTTNKKPFLWSLAESDVSFTETIFGAYTDMFKYDSSQEICQAVFFSPDDIYGKTFYNWAPFFAQEEGVELVANYLFSDDNELKTQLNEYLNIIMGVDERTSISGFCVAENTSQMCDVARIIRKAVITNSVLSFFFDTDDPDDPSLDSNWQMFSAFYKN